VDHEGNNVEREPSHNQAAKETKPHPIVPPLETLRLAVVEKEEL
jgi:hypothetical protein